MRLSVFISKKWGLEIEESVSNSVFVHTTYGTSLRDFECS